MEQVKEIPILATVTHIIDKRNTKASDPVYYEAEAAPVLFTVNRHGYQKAIEYSGVKAEGETREEAMAVLQVALRMMARHDGVPEEMVERITVVQGLTPEEEQLEHVQAMAKAVLEIPDLNSNKAVILSPQRVKLAMNAVYKLGYDAARAREKKSKTPT